MASGAAHTPRFACVDVFLREPRAQSREPRADMERASSTQVSSESGQPVYSTICTTGRRDPPGRYAGNPTSVVSIPASVRSPYTPTRPRRDLLRYLSTAPTSRGARGATLCRTSQGIPGILPSPPRMAPGLLPRPPSHLLPQRQTGDLSRDPDAARPGGPDMPSLVPSCTSDVVCAEE